MDWNTVFASVVSAGIISAVVALIGHAISSRNAIRSSETSRGNALLSAKIANERAVLEGNLKLAEFRQAWIDALRADMSKAFGLAMDKEATRGINLEFQQVASHILLRMNPEDDHFDDLKQHLRNLSNRSFAKSDPSANDYIFTCQTILKGEWDTLKDEIALTRK